MILSRADNSGFARWWWTIDRVSLVSVLSLVVIGILLFTGWKGWEMVYNHHVAVLDAPGQTSSEPVTTRGGPGRRAA